MEHLNAALGMLRHHQHVGGMKRRKELGEDVVRDIVADSSLSRGKV